MLLICAANNASLSGEGTMPRKGPAKIIKAIEAILAANEAIRDVEEVLKGKSDWPRAEIERCLAVLQSKPPKQLAKETWG
jgi:hypothetical protein